MSPPSPAQGEDPASPLPKAKRPNSASDVSPLEREIDHGVYRLCGLTREEIKIAVQAG
jgi:hypothetical protein